MKKSQFNVFFYHDDSMVGYNGFSNEFVILNPELYSIYEAADKASDWEGLQEIHPSFYEYLIQMGFLISSDTNEIDEVKRAVQQIDHENDKTYLLTINPTMNCNFKCWYCYETHIKASKMTPETLQSIVNHAKHILDTKPQLEHFDISWFGGEPLLYFDKTVLPILKQITPLMKERGITFSSGFTSNGFLINQSVIDACKEYNSGFFQITLDGYRDRHNQVRFVSKERGSYDEIVHNIKLCLQNEVTVSVRINISEETLENIMKITDDFMDLSEKEKQYLDFSFHEVWQEEKEIAEDIQEVVNKFREMGLHTKYIGTNLDSVRNSCYADKSNHATINYNGDVFKCTARDFETSSREGYLDTDGKIVWNHKFEKRMDAKFNNPPCLSCKILPICNGGCSQQAIEHEGIEYCVNGFDENKKLSIVKDKYLYVIS